MRALAGGHSRSGHDVHVAVVLSSAEPDHAFLESLRGIGATVHVLVVSDRAYLRERALVRDLCQRVRPDVVHTHGYRPDVVDAGVAKGLGIPAITTVHGFTGNHWRNRLYERVQRIAFRRFDCVVAVSASLGTELARNGVPPERITILKNAWSGEEPMMDRAAARSALGLPRDGFRVGYVGRLTPEKGPDVMIDALAHVDGAPVALSMIGQGRARAALEARAAVLGVADQITWHGLRRDAPRLIPAFDVFVLSSRTEGTPIVLFEAMAAGVPIVATRVGGVPDVVSAAEARVVPPADPAALGAAIADVRDDPAAAAARARAAQHRLAIEFSIEPWLARYEALYRSVMRAATTPVAAL